MFSDPLAIAAATLKSSTTNLAIIDSLTQLNAEELQNIKGRDAVLTLNTLLNHVRLNDQSAIETLNKIKVFATTTSSVEAKPLYSDDWNIFDCLALHTRSEIQFNALVLASLPFVGVKFRQILLRQAGLSELSEREITPANLEETAKNTAVIAHQHVMNFLPQFIAFMNTHGSAAEKAVYAGMTPDRLIARLFNNRPLCFYYARKDKYSPKSDIYILRNGAFGYDGFENIGTDHEQAPLVIKDYLSYREMLLSALLSIASPTLFVNNGARDNEGKIAAPSTIQPQGVYVGQVGARFEKPGVTEYLLMVVDKDQNTEKSGFGAKADINNPQTVFLRLWAKFYGREYFPTYEELTKLTPEQLNINVYVKVDNKYLDIKALRIRLRMVTETYLLDANRRAIAAEKKAYVQAAGLGLGVWALENANTHITNLVIEVYAQVIHDRKNELTHIAAIDFSWFASQTNFAAIQNTSHQDVPSIKLLLSTRNPADQLTGEFANHLLIANYAWDSNSGPGNEVIRDMLKASGDPAAFCCSQIGVFQQALINTYLNSTPARVYGNAAPTISLPALHSNTATVTAAAAAAIEPSDTKAMPPSSNSAAAAAATTATSEVSNRDQPIKSPKEWDIFLFAKFRDEDSLSRFETLKLIPLDAAVVYLNEIILCGYGDDTLINLRRLSEKYARKELTIEDYNKNGQDWNIIDLLALYDTSKNSAPELTFEDYQRRYPHLTVNVLNYREVYGAYNQTLIREEKKKVTDYKTITKLIEEKESSNARVEKLKQIYDDVNKPVSDIDLSFLNQAFEKHKNRQLTSIEFNRIRLVNCLARQGEKLTLANCKKERSEWTLVDLVALYDKSNSEYAEVSRFLAIENSKDKAKASAAAAAKTKDSRTPQTPQEWYVYLHDHNFSEEDFLSRFNTLKTLPLDAALIYLRELIHAGKMGYMTAAYQALARLKFYAREDLTFDDFINNGKDWNIIDLLALHQISYIEPAPYKIQENAKKEFNKILDHIDNLPASDAKKEKLNADEETIRLAALKHESLVRKMQAQYQPNSQQPVPDLSSAVAAADAANTAHATDRGVIATESKASPPSETNPVDPTQLIERLEKLSAHTESKTSPSLQESNKVDPTQLLERLEKLPARDAVFWINTYAKTNSGLLKQLLETRRPANNAAREPLTVENFKNNTECNIYDLLALYKRSALDYAEVAKLILSEAAPATPSAASAADDNFSASKASAATSSATSSSLYSQVSNFFSGFYAAARTISNIIDGIDENENRPTAAAPKKPAR